jgi:CBS domain-containing protein
MLLRRGDQMVERYAGHCIIRSRVLTMGTTHDGGRVRVQQIMTPDPAACTPDTTAQEAAALMRDNDCGSIPVVENITSRRLIGTVTDRDLAVRGIANGKGPQTIVRELMTPDPISCVPEDEIEDLRQVMIEQPVRRVPVVDTDGRLVGIVAQADLAREDGAASDREVGRIVEAISEPRSDLRE